MHQIVYPIKEAQGNRGDMRKIQVTRLTALRVIFSQKEKGVFR